MTAASEPIDDGRPQAPDQSSLIERITAPDLLAGVVITMLAFSAYWITGPANPPDSFTHLAEAFASGRISIAVDRPWLELIPVNDGTGAQYSPFPPIPAVVLVPFVWLTQASGTGELDSAINGAVLGAANVALVYWLLGRIGVAFAPRQLLTIGFAFTTHWWVAGMSGTHHWAQVVAVFFLLLALHVGATRRWPVLAGLCLALAAGSRLPMAFSLPLFLALYAGRWRPTRAHAWLLAGIAVPALLIAAYNMARFGSPIDFGYARIPSGDTGVVTDEPWFRYGLTSPLYVPRHLYAIFLQSFDWRDTFPYLMPNLTGLSLTLSAPFYFWSVNAWRVRRVEPLVPVAMLSVLLVLLPDITHGSWGFAQFGYRFILDAAPILMVLLGWAYRERASGWLIAAVALGVAVHAYGIYVVNILEFVA
ncbi:MAG TPA: hypothetical protein VFK61_08200 [Candidatus Limnocylindria bacterium]|nr:hypothetical protein [Candidatus Limnocylindria bacterium]